MIITISGTPGSGKSTVGKLLAQKLKLQHYSMGDLQREIAEERGISLLELGELEKSDKSIDQELDKKQQLLGKEQHNFIIDGRLSYHFIPRSLKIFIDADIEARAQRILRDVKTGKRKEKAHSLQEVIAQIKIRQGQEQERFSTYYHLNPFDKKKYDLLIDSTSLTPKSIVEKIIQFIKKNNKTYKP